MKKIILFGILLKLLFPLFAEEIILKNGNRLYGKIVEQDENNCVLETGFGLISLSWSQIKEVRGIKSLLEQYWEYLNQCDPENVEQLWNLAVWCEENQMENQRNALLAKILILNPNHVKTLRHLQFKLYNGQWISAQAYQQLTQPLVPQSPPPLVISETITTEIEMTSVDSEPASRSQRIYRDPYYTSWPNYSQFPYVNDWQKEFERSWGQNLDRGKECLVTYNRKREPHWKRCEKKTEAPQEPLKRKWIPKKAIVDTIARPMSKNK